MSSASFAAAVSFADLCERLALLDLNIVRNSLVHLQLVIEIVKTTDVRFHLGNL